MVVNAGNPMPMLLHCLHNVFDIFRFNRTPPPLTDRWIVEHISHDVMSDVFHLLMTRHIL